MKKSRIPQTDSIQELARFWDTHEFTAFEDDLEEVNEPVFERAVAVTNPLNRNEVHAVDAIARSEGVDPAELVRRWVIERIRTL